MRSARYPGPAPHRSTTLRVSPSPSLSPEDASGIRAPAPRLPPRSAPSSPPRLPAPRRYRLALSRQRHRPRSGLDGSAPCPTGCVMRSGATPCRPGRSRSACGSTPARCTRRTTSAAGRISSSICCSGAPRISATGGRGRSGSSSARASAATATPGPADRHRLYAEPAPCRPGAARHQPAVLAEMARPASSRPRSPPSGRSCWPKRAGGPNSAWAPRAHAAPLLSPACFTPTRDTIGTDETLNGATADGLKAFYRRWYRPERTTIVMVGDADPAMMEELIRARFGGWRAEGPAPAEPDYGRIAEVPQPVAGLAYPGAPSRDPDLAAPLRAAPAHAGRASGVPRGGARRADHQPPAGGACPRQIRLPRRLVARRARATSPTPPSSRWSRATATGAGAERGLRDHRRCAARAAERGRDRARDPAICAPPSTPPCRARPTQVAGRAPTSWSMRSTNGVVATAQTARNFEAAAPR